jgi:hypothetical protein
MVFGAIEGSLRLAQQGKLRPLAVTSATPFRPCLTSHRDRGRDVSHGAPSWAWLPPVRSPHHEGGSTLSSTKLEGRASFESGLRSRRCAEHRHDCGGRCIANSLCRLPAFQENAIALGRPIESGGWR